jgi:RNA polymerase sigma-54 factor
MGEENLMAMELKLVPKLQQQLVMTPQLKMAIKLLTLNHLELQDAVSAEMVDNPVLEEGFEDTRADGVDAEPPSAPAPSEAASEVSFDAVGTEKQKDNTADIDWENYADSYSYLPPAAGSGRDTNYDDLPGYDQTLTRAETLEEHLGWQVRMSDMNPLECEIAVRLIGEMNPDGFLDRGPVREPPSLAEQKRTADKEAAEKAEKEAKKRAQWERDNGRELPKLPTPEPVAPAEEDLLMDGPEAEGLREDGDGSNGHAEGLLMDGPAALVDTDPVALVAQELDVPEEWVENVRRRVMTLDPVGCLSRDLRECLLVQLEVWGYDDECLVYNIIDTHLGDIERRNFQAVAKHFKVPLAEVGDAIKLLEALEPRPARNFLPSGESETSQYITPDVYVQKVGDEYVISLNEDGLPKLRISQFYLSKLKSAERGDPSKSYIKDKMRSATWLIRSIHQRQRTIYKVCESIMKAQRDWFDGVGPLKPLILKEVADDIEMHESTVSRVTTRKYLHCHRGIFELKYFFNSSIATGGGGSIASEAVKDEIKKIIAVENPKRPLSDAAIVKLLKDKNIDIARRTVAKYREMLGILPSNKRKQVF